MRIRTIEDRVIAQCQAQGIIYDQVEGLANFSPGIMMFYGVKRDKGLVKLGMGRQQRYLALIGPTIIIQLYENQIAI